MKLVPPTGQGPSTRRGPTRHAQEAAIEKELSRYLALSCGHYCPKEVELIYRVFGNGTDVMCEQCGIFVPIVKQTIKDVIPQEPLF